MASISTIKEAIRLCRDARVTPFIWGHRGMGKSSSVKQVAVENGWGFIDMRLSQCEASDIRGLPDRSKDGRTCYLPPEDLPVGDLTPKQIENELGPIPDEGDLEAERQFEIKLQSMQRRFNNGILFLDEVNRAQDDVLQAVFQLILDRRVGQYILPPGWAVVCAGNYMEGYMVSGFNDPAFLDRFCHLILSGGETTIEEWVNYMSSVHEGSASDVIEFASQNIKHLDGEVQGELGFSVQPSRRSWEAVVRVQKNRAGYSDTAYVEVLGGLIGKELALSYSRYSCPVKPRALLADGVAAHVPKLKKLQRNEMCGVMWGLVSYCKNRIAEDEVATVCLDFTSYLAEHFADKDIVVAFARALVSSGNANDSQEKARVAVISNPKLAAMIGKFSAKNADHKKTFIDRLNERPELQKILSKVSWGTDDDDKKK